MRLTSAKKYVIYFCDIKHVHRFINHIKNFLGKKTNDHLYCTVAK